MTGPITPDEALKILHIGYIPEVVFEIFNALLFARYSEEHAEVVITQEEVLVALNDKGYSRADVYKKKWLDVEPLYEKAGWNVVYDKPAYCESYTPFWKFTRK
jgi:hypothetical protein